jgi:glycolate oxidase iron-sulfur subunit
MLPNRLRAMLSLAPSRLQRAIPAERLNMKPASGAPLRRVALLPGCAQQVLNPEINTATARLLSRHGCEVAVLPSTGCCGALRHHLGLDGHSQARANVLAWRDEVAAGRIDAIVINASGCGTTVKDYGFMFRDDPELAEPAAAISRITRDVTELMTEIGLAPPAVRTGQRVAYHSACSLQHGQGVRQEPKKLLQQAGFEVVDVPDGHLCCGSAGTYNLLQPELSGRLLERKVQAIESRQPQIVAAGNIGCISQIASGTRIPVVHTVQLLDWATGGPRPFGADADAVTAANGHRDADAQAEVLADAG